MKRTSLALYTEPQPFNDKAHEIVTAMIDAAELALIRKGMCEPHETDEYLTMDYIKECGIFAEHMAFYVESEGRIAADLFLWRISEASKGPLKARYNRHYRACSLQLHWHTHFYFRRYFEVLRHTYLQLLVVLPTVAAIDQSGVLKLAAANLSGVRTDIRRERRRRGADSDRLIVADETIDHRISHVATSIISNMIEDMGRKYLTSS